MLRQNIMVAGICGRRGSSPHGGQEAEREDRLGTFKGMPHFLQPPEISIASQNCYETKLGDQVFNT
jgi:hypothetical protein